MKGSLTITPGPQAHFIKPGLHSHNVARRIDVQPPTSRVLRFVSAILFLLGLCGIAYYAYALSDEYVYQAYENWAFDQKIAGRQVTFGDYVRERTPFGFLTGERKSTPTPRRPSEVQPSVSSVPAEGSVLGRIDIARLNLSAIVREGIDEKTLSRAVGHLPDTALPGQAGNFAIAAHRDTLFRALKDIQKDDRIGFQSPAGTYTYEVISTKIVKPSDLSVIQPEGSKKLLTMITCYPFYYIGAAPKRFIVQARLIESEDASTEAMTESHNMGPPPTEVGAKRAKPKAAKAVHSGRHRERPKKPGLSRKLFHLKQS
jgi:sortase A